MAAAEGESNAAPWNHATFVGEMALAWSRVEVVPVANAGEPQTLAAFLVYWLVADELHLLNIAVHPDYRRRGLGRWLMAHLQSVARGHGCARIVLEVRRGNLAAQALYRADGFLPVGERPGYYSDNGEAAVLMERLVAND